MTLYKPSADCWSYRNADANSAFENFYGGIAAARLEFLSRLRDFYLDLAGPAHLHALLYIERLRQRQLAILYQIGGQRTGSRAGGRVFINFPRQHAARADFVCAVEREAIRHGAVFSFETAQ